MTWLTGAGCGWSRGGRGRGAAVADIWRTEGQVALREEAVSGRVELRWSGSVGALGRVSVPETSNP